MERVVVTGASEGIGAACVGKFQELGAEVVGVDVSGRSNADDHLELDLGRPDCGEVLARYLGDRVLDGLVNNAAVQLNAPVEEINAEAFDRIYAVNLRAPLLLSGALKPKLEESEGFIVNVASVHAVATTGSISAYAATKGGLVALTRALAVELAPNIRVNVVLPGAVDTEMLLDGLSRTDMSLAELADRHPLRRTGSPEDVADAVLFLAQSEFATGTTLTIDGGATAHLSTE